MKHILTLLVFALAINSCKPQNEATHKGEFDWLVGSWERTNGKPGTKTLESWKKMDDHSYKALSVVLKDKDTVYKENCTIMKEGEQYYYIAEVPQNPNPTKFKIVGFSDKSFKATNPNHDFPKEIKYSLSNHIIKASVSGNGKQIDYIFGESDSLSKIAPKLREDEINYIEENIIQVSESENDANWEKAAAVFADKKFLLLGEFNHGSDEVFTLRNELIKSLHTNHNYNVILFESGIGEIGVINLQRNDLAEEQMILGFFGGWRNAAHINLMKYVKNNDIKVSGFDVQRTGNNLYQLFSERSRAKKLLELESRFSDAANILRDRQSKYTEIKDSIKSLVNDYKVFQSMFESNYSETNESQLIISRTVKNRIEFLNYMLDFQKTKDWSKRWRDRDKMMANNVLWLVENFYKNEKIILVGHNYHISKFNKNEDVMGAFLKPKFGAEMYSIGVFAFEGTYSNNSGKTETLWPADTYRLDIKHVIKSLDGYANFLNIPDHNDESTNWLRRDIVINDTFLDLSGSNTMTLANQFDGLLFVKSVSPSKK